MNYEDLIYKSENEIQDLLKKVDEQAFLASQKIIKAFHKYNVNESHFNGTTGYGYDDLGRDTIEKVFSEILGAEDSLVRNQFISGSHALNVGLFGILRPNDIMLSITGEPYETLKQIIGIKENNSSLKSFNIRYEQVDLVNNDFDYETIGNKIKKTKYKLVHIQRSRGYSSRESISIEKLEKIIKYIKNLDKDIIIFVDNCYCELVSFQEPTTVGADIIVGSLIKNLGGGIAPNGGYIAGKKNLISLISERLTVPGQGKEVGPSFDFNKQFLLGLYMAPSVVSASLKFAILSGYVLEKLGYCVSPKYNQTRADIVNMISFKSEEKMISFIQGIQKGSAISASFLPVPTEMPGYDDKIIMASGSFTQGSSIEISCDGPIKEPYNAFLQGSMTYEYGKIAFIEALKNMENN